jgi:dTDP-glucose 4,6-dehydratase
MTTIFVTGGAGFIGSAFIHLVLEETTDVKIINFDALTYAGNPENLKGLDAARHTFIKGDICDKTAVLDALPEATEAIFNFAAESHVDRSISSASEFVTTNVLGTQVLLDAARARNVRRFVHISTDEVMGSLPEDDTAFFTENSPLAPNSPYAASKAAAEHFVRAARETFGVDTIITRCGNNYGQRQFPEKLIPLIIANAMNDEHCLFTATVATCATGFCRRPRASDLDGLRKWEKRRNLQRRSAQRAAKYRSRSLDSRYFRQTAQLNQIRRRSSRTRPPLRG